MATSIEYVIEKGNSGYSHITHEWQYLQVAAKKIEKLKKGLSQDSEVKDALVKLQMNQ